MNQTPFQIVETIHIPNRECVVPLADGFKPISAMFTLQPREGAGIVDAQGKEASSEPAFALCVNVLHNPNLPRRPRYVIALRSGEPIPVTWKVKPWTSAIGPPGCLHVLELLNPDQVRKKGPLHLVKNERSEQPAVDPQEVPQDDGQPDPAG